MKKSLIALALVSAFAAPVFAEEAAPTPVHTFTGNVTLASDYVFRGISQSQRQPAIQGGFDYSHASGLYAGFQCRLGQYQGQQQHGVGLLCWLQGHLRR